MRVITADEMLEDIFERLHNGSTKEELYAEYDNRFNMFALNVDGTKEDGKQLWELKEARDLLAHSIVADVMEAAKYEKRGFRQLWAKKTEKTPSL